ncbi:hypothetical protein KL919_003209 [Ogataea angusta]|nr:hypothetical protein KL920_002763 [Ogataea angusta]KAG7858763.1 hypothetical protein KL939_002885 [Ogataea angusta]KAG7859144.1 hypothetical protein KL919_003209 [Ogataea angusta]
MCILLTSSLHPEYPFILLSNRDEYFSRKTELASFKDESHTQLRPIDLAREEHGTWIGVNKAGKVAVLVNFREPNTGDPVGQISRGLIPVMFLESKQPSDTWEKEVGEQTQNFQYVGGFSLLYGELKRSSNSEGIEPLHIISNRSSKKSTVLNGRATVGLSNSEFEKPWPKVHIGISVLEKTIKSSVTENWSEELLVQNLFTVLSTPTPDSSQWQGLTFSEAFSMFPESVFIPPVKSDTGSDYYGTRTQTIMLLRKDGYMKFIERNLHSCPDLFEIPQISEYGFQLDGWKS